MAYYKYVPRFPLDHFGTFSQQASGFHLTAVLRLSILVVAAIASGLAMTINSIYGLS